MICSHDRTDGFSTVAVNAVEAYVQSGALSPHSAWSVAAQKVYPHSVSMQEKGCPRTTFLALCAKGAIKSVASGEYVRESANVQYALDALELLRQHPNRINCDARRLWMEVTQASGKAYNQQMHVGLGLARANLLQLG
jgi:hypothetical protein